LCCRDRLQAFRISGRTAHGLNSFGLIGLLVRSSPNVETALQSFVRYFYLHLQGAVVALTVDANKATLRFDIYQARAKANDQVGAAAVAVIFNILRELCGLAWKPEEICFAQRRPEDVEPFRKFFRAPLRFDAEHYAVVFLPIGCKTSCPIPVRNCVGWCKRRSTRLPCDMATISRNRYAASCVAHS